MSPKQAFVKATIASPKEVLASSKPIVARLKEVVVKPFVASPKEVVVSLNLVVAKTYCYEPKIGRRG